MCTDSMRVRVCMCVCVCVACGFACVLWVGDVHACVVRLWMQITAVRYLPLNCNKHLSMPTGLTSTRKHVD